MAAWMDQGLCQDSWRGRRAVFLLLLQVFWHHPQPELGRWVEHLLLSCWPVQACWHRVDHVYMLLHMLMMFPAGSSDALTEAAQHFGRLKREKQAAQLVQRYKRFRKLLPKAEADRQWLKYSSTQRLQAGSLARAIVQLPAAPSAKQQRQFAVDKVLTYLTHTCKQVY